MSPRTREQLDTLKENRRNQIMDAALILFAKKGFYQVTIEEIAKKSKIAKGLFYTYFDNKDDLLKTIILEGFRNFSINFDPNNDGILEKSELEFYLRTTFLEVRKNVEFWKLYMSLVAQSDISSKYINEVMQVVSPMLKMLKEYFEREKFKDPEIEMMLFHSMLDGIMMNFVVNPKDYPIDKIIENIIDKYCGINNTVN